MFFKIPTYPVESTCICKNNSLKLINCLFIFHSQMSVNYIHIRFFQMICISLADLARGGLQGLHPLSWTENFTQKRSLLGLHPPFAPKNYRSVYTENWYLPKIRKDTRPTEYSTLLHNVLNFVRPRRSSTTIHKLFALHCVSLPAP